MCVHLQRLNDSRKSLCETVRYFIDSKRYEKIIDYLFI